MIIRKYTFFKFFNSYFIVIHNGLVIFIFEIRYILNHVNSKPLELNKLNLDTTSFIWIISMLFINDFISKFGFRVLYPKIDSILKCSYKNILN